MIGEDFAWVLDRAQHGDESAFTVLWRDLNPALLRYLAVLGAVENPGEVFADHMPKYARSKAACPRFRDRHGVSSDALRGPVRTGDDPCWGPIRCRCLSRTLRG